MISAKRRYVRKALFALAALALAGWMAPFFLSGERYRRQLAAGLGQALGRPVRFGAISMRLLPRPGFTVQNVVIGEDPSFGLEPFARVEEADCYLAWRSVFGSRIACSRVLLEQAHVNLVRDSSGHWNIESLLQRGGAALAAEKSSSASRALEIEADDARLDFIFADVKIPFAVTDLRARIGLQAEGQAVQFRLQGSPIRADLTLPTPGAVDLEGEWHPSAPSSKRLKATFRTHNALLDDWIALCTGHDPNLYGLLDANVRLSGSSGRIAFEGRSSLTQLHRTDQPPPSRALPLDFHFRGSFAGRQGRLLVEGADLDFANSQIHLAGAVENLPTAPDFDLVLAVERSHLADFGLLEKRLIGLSSRWKLDGRIDGLLTIRGPQAQRRYAGFLSVREARLYTPAGTFPVSDAGIRIDRQGAELAPARVSLAPQLSVVAQGGVTRTVGAPPLYSLTLSIRRAPLAEMIRVARGAGAGSLDHVGGVGEANATLTLTGTAWPPGMPTLQGRGEVKNAVFRLPGVTRPLRLELARLKIENQQIVAEPLKFALGESVFSGRLEHLGPPSAPWTFDLTAPHLDAGRAALWFDALGRTSPSSFFWRLPGIRSLVARRDAASELFSRLHAEGRLRARLVAFRALKLRQVDARAEIGRRVIRISSLTFRAGGGRGQATVGIDLAHPPAVIDAKLSLAGAALQSLRAYLPPQLAQVRGAYTFNAQLASRGLGREEAMKNLSGSGVVRVQNVNLGNFDPLRSLGRQPGGALFISPRSPQTIESATAHFTIADGRLLLSPCVLEFPGARLALSGSYDFGTGMDLDVRANGVGIRRSWAASGSETNARNVPVEIHLAGPIAKPARVRVSRRVSEAHP